MVALRAVLLLCGAKSMAAGRGLSTRRHAPTAGFAALQQ